MINPSIQSIGTQGGSEEPSSAIFSFGKTYLERKRLEMWFQGFFEESRPTTNYRKHWLADTTLQTQHPSDSQSGFSVLFPHDLQIQIGDVIGHHLRQEQLRQEIDELLETASVENWNGEGALAVKQETAEIAKQLINYFPGDIEKPDVEATPRGEVDFDWILSRDAMLTVSVGPSNEITFVGSFRSVDFHGTEPWTGVLPCFIHCGFGQLRSLSDI